MDKLITIRELSKEFESRNAIGDYSQAGVIFRWRNDLIIRDKIINEVHKHWHQIDSMGAFNDEKCNIDNCPFKHIESELGVENG